MSRGNIYAEKVLLDGMYLLDVGAAQTWVNIITCILGIKHFKAGGKVPDRLVEKIFGKGNTAIVKMLFEGMTARSVKNVFTEVYRYHLADRIHGMRHQKPHEQQREAQCRKSVVRL